MSRGPSVGRRLSAWLALQGIVGTAVICAVVYLDARANLARRQEEAIANKRVQVQHLLREASGEPAFAPLKHKLDDFFVGHDEVSLELRDPTGTLLYASATRMGNGAGARSIRFDAPRPQWSDAALTATLYLDVRDDALLLQRLTLTLVLAAIGASALASITGYLLVRTGLRPIGSLAEHARGLGADTLHRRLGTQDQPAELLPLVDQFNELLNRLDLAYTQLEAFNSDVAHELCTPLATLISSSEVALRRARNSAELQDLVGSNLEELRRLADIVRDMLFLSRADRGASARTEQTASIAATVRAVGEYHDAAIDAAGLRLEVVGDASGWIDRALLRRALSNLLGNATRYASRGSTITVAIRAAGDGRIATLSVRNAGPEIAPEALPRIFDRFYRADKARAAASENHGLGLAIVAAIARMHNGDVFARSGNGWTEVGLTLDIAQRSPGTTSAEAAT